MQQAARGRTATRRSQCSRVGDVEERLHGICMSNCLLKACAAVAKVAHLTRVLLKLQRVSRRTVAIRSQVLRSVRRIIAMTHEASNGTSLTGEGYAQVGNVRG